MVETRDKAGRSTVPPTQRLAVVNEVTRALVAAALGGADAWSPLLDAFSEANVIEFMPGEAYWFDLDGVMHIGRCVTANVASARFEDTYAVTFEPSRGVSLFFDAGIAQHYEREGRPDFNVSYMYVVAYGTWPHGLPPRHNGLVLESRGDVTRSEALGGYWMDQEEQYLANLPDDHVEQGTPHVDRAEAED